MKFRLANIYSALVSVGIGFTLLKMPSTLPTWPLFLIFLLVAVYFIWDGFEKK